MEESVTPNAVVNEVENTTEGHEILNVTYQNVIRKLIADGAKRLNSCRIKNVNVAEMDNYTRVSFTLSNPVIGYVSNDNGITYQKGETNVIFVSLYAIVAAIKEDDELSWMANRLLEKPDILNLLLNGSCIDILQQEVPANTEFANPFSNKITPDVQMYDHDIIVNHVIGFKLGKVGQKMADKLADKMLGF